MSLDFTLRDCMYSVEAVLIQRVHIIYVLSKNKKKFTVFHLKIAIFTLVITAVYLIDMLIEY